MGKVLDTTGDIGSILGVWAHPDDEAWLSAGLMMRALAADRPVTCVTATKGEAGFPDDDPRPAEERASIRESEMKASLEVMGVTDHRWLGYGDGRCSQVPDDEAIDRLADIITELRPDAVLSFGPDGNTGHSDHISTCRWATRAVELVNLAGTRLLYATKTRPWTERFYAAIDVSTVMMVDDLEVETVEESELDVWFTCDDDLVARKVAALRAQASQIEGFVEGLGVPGFSALVREEFFREPRHADVDLMERARHLGKP
jgi:LmbE family N-acetylglucosaminyl deacetylase